MTWPYQYTPYMLPMLLSAAFTAVLLAYASHRRSVPGALSLIALSLSLVMWALGAILELAAVDVATKILWVKFQVIWQLPAATAELCFALEYADLSRWLTRRTLGLLAILPLLVLVLVLTDPVHHLIWLSFPFEGYIRPVRGIGTVPLIGYGYLLSLASCLIFVRLFIRSPLHRAPVALILCGILVERGMYLMDAVYNINPVAPMDPAVLAQTFAFATYALALFRFRILDVLPVARETVIDQMDEGMLVLDVQRRIVDLNPAAGKIAGISAARARGKTMLQVLPASSDPSAQLSDPAAAQSEIRIETGHAARYYALHFSPLWNRRGFPLGYLVLLHDVTEQRQAQAQLLEQQRVVATLQERERLARELHDSVSQVLGYVSLQAQAIRKRVHDGQVETAEAQLARLADVAQEAHADIRESILSLRGSPAQEWLFLVALRQYLDSFRDHYGIRTALTISPGLGEQAFEPGVGVQLLRVIQEAMTNARKHGRAGCVQVALELQDDQARILVADDGCGFDPDLLSASAGDHFGLAFMRERLAQIGGDMTIHSQPGAGTQVIFQVPIRAVE